MRSRIALFFLLSIIILSAESFADEPLLIKQGFNGEFIGRHVLHLEDKSRKLTIDDVKASEYKAKFAPENQNTLNFGLSDSAHWLYFPLKNSDKKEVRWILQLEDPLLSRVELYEETSDGKYHAHFGGTQLPIGMRDIMYRKNVFTLTTPPGESGIFIRVASPGKTITNLFMTAWNDKGFTDKNNVENLLLGLFYGSMVALLLYNLFIFLTVRDARYFWYLLYLGSSLFVYISINGLGSLYLWGNSTYMGRESTLIFYFSALGFSWQFGRSFLDTRRHSPFLDRVLLGGAAMTACFWLVALSDVSYTFNYAFAYPTTFPFPFILLYIGINSLRKGERQARFFVTAWSALLLSLPFYILKDIGVVQNSFATVYSVQIGTFIEMILLSFALADRINMMREEKEKAEAETLAVLQKSRDELELRVAERTLSLAAAKEEAERATRLKNDFLTIVSHDLRSPLSSITGMLKIIKKESFGGLLTPRSSESLGKIEGSISRLLILVERLLGHGMVQSGKMVLKKRRLNVRRLSEETIEPLLSLADAKNITITNEIPADMTWYADQNLLGQVFHNLLSNAIKFTKDGTVRLVAHGDTTVEIQDTGIGFGDIFVEDLFREDKKTTTLGTDGEAGTGLGLPHAFAILQAHGGTLTAKSNAGGGGCFIVSLPKHVGVVLLASAKRERRETVREIIQKTINCDVVEAENGVEALKRLEKYDAPDILITGMDMPEMDGLALVAHLRKNAAHDAMPIVVMASEDDGNAEATSAKVISAGADCYLKHPVGTKELQETVRALLRLPPLN